MFFKDLPKNDSISWHTVKCSKTPQSNWSETLFLLAHSPFLQMSAHTVWRDFLGSLFQTLFSSICFILCVAVHMHIRAVNTVLSFILGIFSPILSLNSFTILLVFFYCLSILIAFSPDAWIAGFLCLTSIISSRCSLCY